MKPDFESLSQRVYKEALARVARFKAQRAAIQPSEQQRLLGDGAQQATGTDLAKLNVLANARAEFSARLKALKGFAAHRGDSDSARLAYAQCHANVRKAAEKLAELSGMPVAVPEFLEVVTAKTTTIKPTGWVE